MTRPFVRSVVELYLHIWELSVALAVACIGKLCSLSQTQIPIGQHEGF